MDSSLVIDVVREAMLTTLVISAPLLGVALLLGLLVGLLQAATSINEMTLSFIPKLLGSALTLTLLGGWQLQILTDYMRSIFQKIPTLFM